MVVGSNRTLALGMLSLALLAQPAPAKDVTSELPGEVRALLQKEMVEVQAAMKSIHGAIVRGRHEVVKEKARAIHESFILKQSMTSDMRKKLKAAVPKEFLKLDQKFHKLAARLSESGKAEDTGKQLDIFGNMTRTCVTCHSRYVNDRFEGLRQR
jgi:DNA-binding GntR family transcriptional regulator